MSEVVAGKKKPFTTMAIMERKVNNQKSGGISGIFFQLFDWNRRLSNKKALPKKLLLPSRAQVSKKFNADEKLPLGKYLLIADTENNVGFSNNVKTNDDNKISSNTKNPEMKPPGLVARLMGLEAMPVSGKQNKSNVSSQKDDSKGRDGRLGGGLDNKVDSCPEKGTLRPQKIQKIGVSERRPVTKFGVEGLQIKSVLTKLKKPHHPKVASPTRSPKLGQNMSRLIDTAAARVLEPGVQASNRARNMLSYSNSKIRPPKEDGVDMNLQYQPISKTSCRSCGKFLEEKTAMFDVHGSNFKESFLRRLEERRPRPEAYLENETEVVLLKTRYHPERVEPGERVRNTVHQSSYHERIPTRRSFTLQKNSCPSSSNLVNQRNGQMAVRDRVPPGSKALNVHSKRVSSSGNVVTGAQDFNRVPSKSDAKIDHYRTFCIGKNASQTQRTPVRKRNLNLSRPVDTTGSAGPLYENSRSNKNMVMAQNGPRTRNNPVNQTNIRSRSVSERANSETDVVSFTFRHMRTEDPVDQFSDNKLEDKMVTEVNGYKMPSQNSLQMKGDAIGVLLEQKLKELTHQVENEAAPGFKPSARTTASILQELISALTDERTISYDDEADNSCTKETQYGGDGSHQISQLSKSRIKRNSDNLSCEINHFSPGCTLDASFSNESYIASSIDDNSECTLQPACSDVDTLDLDCASSTIQTRSSNLTGVTDLLNHASSLLQNTNIVHAKLSGTKLNYVLRIILDAELLFGKGNAVHHPSSRFTDFLLGPFLEELEVLVIAAWKDNIILGMETRKEQSPLRIFLLDCVVEGLDIRYCRYSDSGYRAWNRLPKYMDSDNLVKMFDEEIRKWIAHVGKSPDEIIERDMSTSLGKWTDFEVEVFETASQINDELFQTLVDELVIDLVRFGL